MRKFFFSLQLFHREKGEKLMKNCEREKEKENFFYSVIIIFLS